MAAPTRSENHHPPAGRGMHRRRALSLLISAPLVAGCAKNQALVPIGGKTVDASTVDTAPLSLLPKGALMVGRLDAEALFRTQLGGQVANIVRSILPLGPESAFRPARDVKTVYAAAYAMQGADVATILQGTFNVAAMQKAARARAQTPSGTPVVETQYGGYALYTVANVGFVVLTPKSILSGNETGIRRALDRLRYRTLEDGTPAWMKGVLGDGQGEFALAGDLRGQGVLEAAESRFQFLNGLELVRAVGNFESPGMNVVGSLTYKDASSAVVGAQQLPQLRELAYFLTVLSNLGVGGGVAPEIRTQLQGTNVAFASEIDAQLANVVLSMIGKFLRPGSGGIY